MDTWYFVLQINFGLHYHEAKSATMFLKILLVFLDSGILEKKIIKICFIVSH